MREMEEARILAEYARREREIPKDRYSLTSPAVRLAREAVERHIASRLQELMWPSLNTIDILDVGCGHGNWLQSFAGWGADPARLYGIELIPERCIAAQHKLPLSNIQLGSATRLPWADASFDVVTQFVVFTSILDPVMRRQVASEMIRVLKPNGRILWYDFRFPNPYNANVRRVGLREIGRLFPGSTVDAESITLAPPLARMLTPISPKLARVAEALPFLRSHLVAVITPQSPHGCPVIT